MEGTADILPISENLFFPVGYFISRITMYLIRSKTKLSLFNGNYIIGYPFKIS